MSVDGGSHGALEYYPCRYGTSRVLFRGPRKSLEGEFVAFLGATETYGRFIEMPFPQILENALGVACVNLGALNAGIDLYLHDPALMEVVLQSEVKVVQVMGAQTLSNRFYSVHPRRNDRFLRASERLEELYPEVDFTEFHFVRHMLGHLQEVSEGRFEKVVSELRNAWTARMKHLLTQLQGRVVLLWFADQPPPGDGPIRLNNDPLFVTRNMIEALRPRVAHVVEAVPSHEARLEGTAGMVFNDFDACVALELQGPTAHEEAADGLARVLMPMLGLAQS